MPQCDLAILAQLIDLSMVRAGKQTVPTPF